MSDYYEDLQRRAEKLLSANQAKEDTSEYFNMGGEQMLQDPRFLNDLRKWADDNGKSFSTDAEMVDWWYADRRNADMNSVGTLLDMGGYSLADDEAQAYRSRLSRAWETAPARDFGWEKFRDYGASIITDPLNLVGIGLAGQAARHGYRAARAAGATTKAARNRALMSGVAGGVIAEASIGGATEAIVDPLNQARQIQQGVREEYSPRQTLEAIGMGAATGGVIGGGLGAGTGFFTGRSMAGAEGEAAEAAVEAAPAPAPAPAPEGELSLTGGQGQAPEQPEAQPTETTTPEQRLEAERGLLQQEIQHTAQQMARPDLSRAEREIFLEQHQQNLADLRDVETQLVTQKTNTAKIQEKEAKVASIQSEIEAASAKAAAETDPTARAELEAELQRKTGELDQAISDLEITRMEPNAPDQGPSSTIRMEDGQLISNPTLPFEGPARAAPAAQQASQPAESPAAQPNAGDTPELETDDRPMPAISQKLLATLNEYGLDPRDIKGSGKNGRIISSDVKEATKGLQPPEPEFDPRSLIDDGVVLDEDGNPLPDLEPEAPAAEAGEGDEALARAEAFLQQNLSDLSSDMIDEEIIAKMLGNMDDAEASEAGLANLSTLFANRENYAGSPDFIEGPALNDMEKQELQRRINGSYRGFVKRISMSPAGKSYSAKDIKDLWEEYEDVVRERHVKGIIQDRSKRLSDIANKASTTLSSGPVTAGRSTVTTTDVATGEKKVSLKPQSFLKSGSNVGDDYTVIGRAPNKGEWTPQIIDAQYARDAKLNKAKPVYQFTALGSEVVYGKRFVQKGDAKYWANKYAKAGDTLYYAPGLKKIFDDPDHALAMTGYGKPGSSFKQVELPDIDTLRDLRAKALAKFKEDGDLATYKSTMADIEDLFKRVQAKISETPAEVETPTEAPAARTQPSSQADDGLEFDAENIDFEAEPSTARVDTRIQDYVDLRPVLDDGRRLAIIKRDPSNPGQAKPTLSRDDLPRILADSQVKSGQGIEALLGKASLDDYAVGYITPGVRKSDSRFVQFWEPVDAKNKLGGSMPPLEAGAASKTPQGYEAGPSPIDLDDIYQVSKTARKYKDLTAAQQRAYSRAISTRAGGTTVFNENAPITVRSIYNLLQGLESSEFNPVNSGSLSQNLETLNGLLGEMAPSGVRLPHQDRISAIENIKKVSDEAPQEVVDAMISLMERARGDNKPIINQTRSAAENYYMPTGGKDFNTINLSKVNGSKELFYFAHEFGHWAYRNIMTPEERSQFWSATRKYLDENGNLRMEGLKELRKRSPVSIHPDYRDMYTTSPQVTDGGPSNALIKPQEFFANQFALYLMKNDKVFGVASGRRVNFGDTFWGDIVTKLTKVINFLRGQREMVDEDLAKIFKNIVVDPIDAKKLEFAVRKTPETELGKALERRYMVLKEEVKEVDELLASGNAADAGQRMINILNEFASVATSQRQAKALAAQNGVPYREGYSGSFKVTRRFFKMMSNANADVRRQLGLSSVANADGETFIDWNIDKENKIYELWTNATSYKPDGTPDRMALADITAMILNEYERKFRQVEKGELNGLDAADLKITIKNGKYVDGQPNDLRGRNFYALKKRSKEAKQKRLASEAKQAANKPAEAGHQGKPMGKLSDMSDAQLLEKYNADPNSSAGKAAAKALAHRMQAEAPKSNVSIPRETQLKRKADLYADLTKAMTTGDNKTRDIVIAEFQRREAKNSSKRATDNIAPVMSSVSDAVKAEVELLAGPLIDGIPAKLPFEVRNLLASTTHRNENVEAASRTALMRLMNLGLPLSLDTKSKEFGKVRTAVRKIAASLQRTEDPSRAARLASQLVAQTPAVEPGLADIVGRAAQLEGVSYKDFVSDLIERRANGTYDPDDYADAFGPEDAGWQADLTEAAYAYHEATAYVLNGLIANPQARAARPDLTVYGDMLRNKKVDLSDELGVTPGYDATSSFDRQLKRSSPEIVDRIENWSNGDVMLINSLDRHDRSMAGAPVDTVISRSISSGKFGSGVYLNGRPRHPNDADVFEATPEELRDAMGKLAASQSLIRKYEFRHAQAVRNNDIDRADAIAEQIERFKSTEQAQSTYLSRRGGPKMDSLPVTLAKGKYLDLYADTNVGLQEDGTVHPFTATVFEELGIRAADLPTIDGPMNPDELSAMVAQASPSGDTSAFTRAAKRLNYKGIYFDGGAVVFRPGDVAHPTSSHFHEEVLPETEPQASPGAVIMKKNIDGQPEDLREDLIGGYIERLGAGPSLTTSMMNMVRGRKTSPATAADARKTARIFWTTLTNGSILKKAGMNYLGNFFEDANGKGGHYERVTEMTARFQQPIMNALEALPGSKNYLKKWFENGPAQLVVGAGQTLKVIPRSQPKQPESTTRVITALRGGGTDTLASAEERNLYDVTRRMFSDAYAVMRQAGLHVGQIDPNKYFPQIWSRDLIEADVEGFTKKMAKFIKANSLRIDPQSTMDDAQALQVASRIRDKILDEDGYLAPPGHSSRESNEDHIDFKRMLHLEQDPVFTDPNNQDSLYAYLENDLMTVTSKYFSGVARRVDHMQKFGYSNHGFHDYIRVLREGEDGVASLLTSTKTYEANTKIIGPAQAVAAKEVHTIFNSPFPATERGREAARAYAQQLTARVRGGEDMEVLRDEMLSLKQDQTPEAARAYAKRIDAILGALYDYQDVAGTPMPVDAKNLMHAEGQFLASLNKPVTAPHAYTKSATKISKALRAFNSVSLLGFTTLTSLGDLALPLINSGSMRATTAAWDNMLREPAYRDMIRNVGAAIENVVHERMIHGFGADSSKLSNGFFNTTLLTPWTTMNRNIGAAVGYEHFRAQQRIAIEQGGRTPAGRRARRILSEYGLDDVFRGASPRSLEAVLQNADDPAHQAARLAIIRFTNESIFTPNPNDIPIWAQTPSGMLMYQFKSFPMAMTRLLHRVLKRSHIVDAIKRRDLNTLREGELGPLLMMISAGPGFAMGSLAAKDVIQMRGGEDNREARVRERSANETLESLVGYNPELHGDFDTYFGWYLEGFIHMGGLGLIGDLLHSTAQQVDNGAYGETRIMSLLGGPSVGTGLSAIKVAAGIFDSNDDSNAKERTAVRETMRRIPILGGMSAPVEGVVDSLAGPAGRRGGSSSSFDLSLDLDLDLDL